MLPALQSGFSSLATVALLAGVVIGVIALGSFLYEAGSEEGLADGTDAPERPEEDGIHTDGVREGGDDEEWDYY